MLFNIHSAKKTKIFCCLTHVALSIDVDVWIKLNKLLIDADVKNQKKKKKAQMCSRILLVQVHFVWMFVGGIVGHNSQLAPTFADCTVGIPTPQAAAFLAW